MSSKIKHQFRKNTVQAFQWIIAILRKNKIPFQVTSGLAAKLYGSGRRLFDIDLDVPEERFQDIVRHVNRYIVYGPEQHVSSHFNLKLLTLKYRGQSIDIGGAYKPRIRHSSKDGWHKCPTNFADAKKLLVMGRIVPVVSREELIHYKGLVRRKVDLEDIQAIESCSTPGDQTTLRSSTNSDASSRVRPARFRQGFYVRNCHMWKKPTAHML
jgi:hypothetical protein